MNDTRNPFGNVLIIQFWLIVMLIYVQWCNYANFDKHPTTQISTYPKLNAANF